MKNCVIPIWFQNVMTRTYYECCIRRLYRLPMIAYGTNCQARRGLSDQHLWPQGCSVQHSLWQRTYQTHHLQGPISSDSVYLSIVVCPFAQSPANVGQRRAACSRIVPNLETRNILPMSINGNLCVFGMICTYMRHKCWLCHGPCDDVSSKKIVS